MYKYIDLFKQIKWTNKTTPKIRRYKKKKTAPKENKQKQVKRK